MLEDKTANNIVTRYHRIVTGDQSKIEVGNPNKVVVVNATLGNPFDDGEGNFIDPVELYELLTPIGDDGVKKTQASAMISFSFSGTDVALSILSDTFDFVAQGFRVLDGSTISTGAHIAWFNNNGKLFKAYLITSGVVSDITTIAENVPCVLTVVYHPLPEE